MSIRISNLKKAAAAVAFGAAAMTGVASAVDAAQPQVQPNIQIAAVKVMGCYTIAKGSHHQPANPRRGVYVVNSTGFWLPAGKLVRFKIQGRKKWRKAYLSQPLAPGATAKATTFNQIASLKCKAMTWI